MAVGATKRTAYWSQGLATYHKNQNKIHKTGRALMSRRICSFWLAGKCNRNPCRFMHSKVPLPPSNTYHRNQGLPSHKKDQRIVKQSFNEAEKHIPSNTYRPIQKQSRLEADKLIQKQSFCKADQCPNESLKVDHAHQSSLVPTLQAVSKAKVDEKAPKARDRVSKFWASGNCVKGLPSHKEDERLVKQSFNEAEKHIPSNTYLRIPKQSCLEADKLIQKQSFCKADQCPNKSLKVDHAHQNSLVPTPQAVSKAKVDKKAPKALDRVCKFWASGNCVKDDCDFLHSWSCSHEIMLVAKLQDHKKEVAGIALPEGSNKLLSGSKDGTVCVWDSHTGQCVQVYNLGGEVGAFICEGPWVFVGLLSFVKAWNIHSNAEYDLAGPVGLIHALTVANDKLFAGVEDGAILAWEVSSEVNPFKLCASLKGHTKAVVSFITGASRLYSGSFDQTIRVWDSTTLECLHTLNGHTDAVTSLLCWDRFLLSCSLDKTVKVWMATEGGNIEVTYTHYEDHGVLSLFGMHDGDVNPVLFCACNDKSVRLYNLPNFTERGRLFSEQEVRTIGLGPGGLFFSGDAAGTLAVWKWSTEAESKIAALTGSTLPSSESCIL